jgi:hypothetical protein
MGRVRRRQRTGLTTSNQEPERLGNRQAATASRTKSRPARCRTGTVLRKKCSANGRLSGATSNHQTMTRTVSIVTATTGTGNGGNMFHIKYMQPPNRWMT